MSSPLNLSGDQAQFITDISPLKIGDEERCGGLYVLGKPRTGKSSLLISLALSDIENGHSVIFIDPHTDAISELLARIPSRLHQNVILLDPTRKTHSFGMNPLQCPDPSDPLELDRTYGRVRDIFVKVWGDQDGQLGVWLEKVLRNSVYLLLENPGYTLVDVPLLLSEDTRFRNYLLQNVSVNPYVKDFWFNEFDRLTRREKTEQVGPALSRLDIFRTNTMVRNIVGQRKPTIDFYEILNERKSQTVVLLRMPTHLADDVKSLIGTILLSQILNAAFERDKLAKGDRGYIGLYCDEFQNFATPDFAKLFTQTGKYKVMPVVAHQERLGQFRPEDPNRGATLAAPNKVLFSLSVHDANELAPEFAKEPPTEMRRERQLVISQQPVAELLRGHPNPDIHSFVQRRLRPLMDQREDIREDIEGERLIRMDLLDNASLFRIDAALEGRIDNYANVKSLENASGAIWMAKAQTDKLKKFHEDSKAITLSLRELNRFFTSIMEKGVGPGDEQFSDFLINRIRETMPERYLKALELYITLTYGSANIKRLIPLEFARVHSFSVGEVALLTDQSSDKTRQAREDFKEKYVKERWDRFLSEWREEHPRRFPEYMSFMADVDLDKVKEAVAKYLANPPKSILKEGVKKYAPLAYVYYVWLACDPELRDMVMPYSGAKFVSRWKERAADIDTLITQLRVCLEPIKFWQKPERNEETIGYTYSAHLKANTVYCLSAFLQKYKEGAFVMLALIQYGLHNNSRGIYPHSDAPAGLPEIEGVEPVEMWLLLLRINKLMLSREGDKYIRAFLKYFSLRHSLWKREKRYSDSVPYDDILSRRAEELMEAGFPSDGFPEGAGSLGYSREWDPVSNEREDVTFLKKELRERWDSFVSAYPRGSFKLIMYHKEFERGYLIRRACDIVYFGEKIANVASPPISRSESTVSALVMFLRDRNAYLEQEEERVAFDRERKIIEKKAAEEISKIYHPPPINLTERILSASEIIKLREACLAELSQHGQERVSAMLWIVEDFVKFCTLLRKQENHIMVPCGHYVEKVVNSRQVADMTNEMAQELMKLPRFTAYAKVINEQDGVQRVITQKITTVPLPILLAEVALEERDTVIEKNSLAYCKPRKQIEEEICQRQERWRGGTREKTPPTEDKGQPSIPGASVVIESEEPPPTSFLSSDKGS